MFRRHWGLHESPFRGSLDWRRFFPSPTHEEALARLNFLVEDHRRLGLLLGPEGCGKSLTLEVFSRQMRRGGAQIANFSLLGADLPEFLWLLAAELGINPDRRGDVFRLWRSLLDRLVENRYQQLATVLLLDDADQASAQVLEHIVRLAASEVTGGGAQPLTIVLTADDNQLSHIPRRLLELAELRIDIEPWEPLDTAQYVVAALNQAGRAAPLFTDPALDRLHDLCEGVPRRVNQLANLALLAGAGSQLNEIDADMIESVYRELAVVEAVA